ncbi:hypothetical protein PRK78_002504 [Emydomyces testavorans]|uniref:Uncharacterized protein n=1 Tax=Emydomyces testavorans TaxID=2070801 RepID=A0AAF0DEG9_9EURO|nr:hypothetical protein PRK78_002504 [Emydomyces testavorans]
MGSLGIHDVAAKTSHVNLMTDTVIANLNAESLRAVIRSMLAGDQEGQLTHVFRTHAQTYLRRELDIKPLTVSFGAGSIHKAIEDLNRLRMRILAQLGCGLTFESLAIVAEIVRHSAALMRRRVDVAEEETLLYTLAAVDANLVQALTPIQQQSHCSLNPARLSDAQRRTLVELKQSLEECRRQSEDQGTEFVYERGTDMLDEILAVMDRGPR